MHICACGIPTVESMVHFDHMCVLVIVYKCACVCVRALWCACVAALNSQSFLGPGPAALAAAGSLGDASPALSSPLYPAGPSLLATCPSQPPDPDRHTTDSNVLMGNTPLIVTHVEGDIHLTIKAEGTSIR